MRVCGGCGAVFPDCLPQCLQCGTVLHSAARFQRGSLQWLQLRRQMGYGAEELLQSPVLRECLLFYDLHAHRFGKRLKRKLLVEILQPLAEAGLFAELEERGRELVTLMFTIGDLGREYREAQAALLEAEVVEPAVVLVDVLAEEVRRLQEKGVSIEAIGAHILARVGKPPAVSSSELVALTPDDFKKIRP